MLKNVLHNNVFATFSSILKYTRIQCVKKFGVDYLIVPATREK